MTTKLYNLRPCSSYVNPEEKTLDETMKKYLETFIKLCYSRLEKGEKTRKGAYKKIDLYEQIMEELADVSNYAFLEYMRIKNLQKMKSRASRIQKTKKKLITKKKRKKRY